MSNFQELSELYSQKKDEYARAKGAMDIYKQQKDSAQINFKNSLYSLKNVSAECKDLNTVSKIEHLVQTGLNLDFTTENLQEFAKEIDSVCEDLEAVIRENLK